MDGRGDVRDLADASACTAYISGVVDTSMLYEFVGVPCQFRLPEGVTNYQIISVVRAHLEKWPQGLHGSSVMLIFGALKSAFPCSGAVK